MFLVFICFLQKYIHYSTNASENFDIYLSTGQCILKVSHVQCFRLSDLAEYGAAYPDSDIYRCMLYSKLNHFASLRVCQKSSYFGI